MTIASDNVFPKVILDAVTSAPAAPSNDNWKLYAMADGVYARSSNATVGPLGSGGGGGAPTDAKYVTTAANGSLSAEIVIPGLAGSPDIPPGGANDDEFATLSGWTTLGSLNTSNATDFASHWHVVKANVGLQIHGIYKASPAATFTVTCKVSDFTFPGNYVNYGLAIGDATPTKWASFTIGYYNNQLSWETWSNNTSRASSANAISNAQQLVRYLRMTVNSTTSVDCYWSQNGYLWQPAFTAQNPGTFTTGNVGLVVQANGQQAEAVFDWIRFT